MTSLYPQPAVVMTTDECWARLSSMSLGRLVTVAGGEPEIVPVNFAVQRRTVIIRTGPGTKLRDVQTNPRVLFEVDDHTFETGWSVVVRGEASVLTDADEIAGAERAQVLPWIASPKDTFIRIDPTAIHGRVFSFLSQQNISYESR